MRGVLVNADTGKPVARDDACVTRSLVGGYHAEADAAVERDVTRVLRTVFKLSPSTASRN